MDKQYGAIELAPGGAAPFRTSLTVATRVISANQPDLVVLDAGFKAMATDAGPALVAGGAAADAAYQFMGDEHGGLRFGAGRRAAVGRRPRDPGRAALRSDRQPARLVSRHAKRASGRYLADRRARLLGD